jgi:hypothetical protein
MLKSGIKFATRLCLAILIVRFISAVLDRYRDAEYHDHIAPAIACINNLRQIDYAAHEFALEHNLTNGSPINFPDDLTSYIKLNRQGKIPPCPAGGIYHISKVGEAPTCSLGSTVTPAHVLP